MLVRRGKRMVCRVPAVLFVVILKHGKVRDPEQFEVARHVAGALERPVFVSVFARQLQTSFAAGGELRLLVGSRAGFSFRGNGYYRNNKVVRPGAAQLADFCRYLRTLFL